MSLPDGSVAKRIDINYWDGVNTHPSWNVATRQEFSHAENATSPNVGIVERRDGFLLLGNDLGATHNFGVFSFVSDNPLSKHIWRVSTVGGVTSIYYLNTSDVWTALTGSGTGLAYTSNPVSVALAEGRCYVVNGEDENLYISEDGLTVTDALNPSVDNDFYRSPKAKKVNYFKGQLYLADVTYSSSNYPNQVQMSSPFMGIVSLVKGNWDVGQTVIDVTDTKYIYTSDTLEVFRGGLHVVDLAVVGKTETSITVTGIGAALISSDELWVKDTNPITGSGKRTFRWAAAPTGGMPVKKYDTFTLTGGGDSSANLLTNVGSYMMIANSDSMATWDGANLQVLDTGIGCVSENGYVKFSGNLFFVHWTGIYVTTGGLPKLVSTPMESYLKGATKTGLQNARCGRKEYRVFFHIGDVELTNPDGSAFRSLSDVVLEYDQHEDNWFAYTGIPATCFATFVDDPDYDRLVFCSNDVGRAEVFAFLEGDYDDGDEIPFRADTSVWQLCANEESVGIPEAVVLYADRGNSIGCYISLDNGNFYEIRGQFDKGVDVVPVTNKDVSLLSPPSCRVVKLSFRSTGKAKPRLTKAALRYFETSAQQENAR